MTARCHAAPYAYPSSASGAPPALTPDLCADRCVVLRHTLVRARSRVDVGKSRLDDARDDLRHLGRTLRAGNAAGILPAVNGVQPELRTHDSGRHERELNARMRGLHFGPHERGQRVQKVLRATVCGANHREWKPPQHRRHVDDVTVATRLEVRQYLLHSVERRMDVRAHHGLEILVGELGGIARDALAGIVDPHVNAATLRQCLVNGAPHLVAVGDVRDDHVRASVARRRHFVQRRSSPRHEHDGHLLPRESLGCGRANARAGAGDDNYFFVHGVHHTLVTFRSRPCALAC